MRIMVTGAGGFIGSHLVDRLLADGHQVIGLDRFSKGTGQHRQVHRNERSLTLHTVDISRRDTLKPAYFKNVAWIFHLAGKTGNLPSLTDPVAYHNANVTGTLLLLEAARRAKVRRFIYAASSSCYGEPESNPVPETAPAKPENPYALTKYLAEQYVLHWGNVYKLPVVSLRLFSVYGPRIRRLGGWGPVVSIFAAQKKAGRPFTVEGDGTQSRDYIFVTDVIDALLAVAKSGIVNDVFNVGTGKLSSINRMVELLGGPVTRVPGPKTVPYPSYADTAKIRRKLQWRARVPFAEGMRRVLARL